MDYSCTKGKEVLKALLTNDDGLATQQAELRIKESGPNAIVTKEKTSFAQILVHQFKNYIIWLLIAIALFALASGLFQDDKEQLVDAAIIGFIILFNAFVGAYQDYKAEKASELLQTLLNTTTRVIRDGKETIIDATRLVPGDIIALLEGDKIPADCRLLSVENLYVNESMLTGESADVEKNIKVLKKETNLADRKNMVYMHTFVVRGRARAVVVQTGMQTEIGKIAHHLENEKPSPFIKEVDDAAKIITYVALGLIIVVSFFLFLKGFNWSTVFMIASALVIGSIPEGLPAVVTFTLATTTARLARQNVLVKRKSLLETLGSIDILCTDKTGTLTMNQMVLSKIYLDGAIQEPSKLKNNKAFEQFQYAALLANEAQDTDQGFSGPAEDLALINYLNSYKIDIIEFIKAHPRDKLEPFNSNTRRTNAHVCVKKKTVVYSKGAPDVMIQSCNFIFERGRRVKFTNKKRAAIQKIIDSFADQGYRVLVLTSAPFTKGKIGKGCFLGLVGLQDPPREEISKVITDLYSAGIDVKMITGDSSRTAIAIAKQCGFRSISAITWDELKYLSEDEMRAKCVSHNIFARMSPEQKLHIVSALQGSGRRVAITGDGVNDAPALNQAEVGIAMGLRGADIAKEAGDIILLDDKLEHVPQAIISGRTVFANVRKVFNYLLTTNLAEVFVVFIVALSGRMPFTAVQLLWVNFVTDVAPAIGLGVDPPHPNIMRQKPTGVDERIITPRLAWLTILIGTTKMIQLLTVFFGTLWYTGNLVLAQTLTFTWLVLTHLIRIIAIRFDEHMPLFINTIVNWAIFVPLCMQLIIIYTPLSKFFDAIAFGWKGWFALAVLMAVSALYVHFLTKLLDRLSPRTDENY